MRDVVELPGCKDPLATNEVGKYDQAEERHRQALGPMETALSKEHPSALMNMSNLC